MGSHQNSPNFYNNQEKTEEANCQMVSILLERKDIKTKKLLTQRLRLLGKERVL